MNHSQLEEIQNNIELSIAMDVNIDNGHEVKQKLQLLSTLLSSGSICIVNAKKLWLLKRGQWLRVHAEKVSNFSPSIAKEFANTSCIDEEILFTRCERNYSALVHCIDSLRSILSHLKSEMNIN